LETENLPFWELLQKRGFCRLKADRQKVWVSVGNMRGSRRRSPQQPAAARAQQLHASPPLITHATGNAGTQSQCALSSPPHLMHATGNAGTRSNLIAVCSSLLESAATQTPPHCVQMSSRKTHLDASKQLRCNDTFCKLSQCWICEDEQKKMRKEEKKKQKVTQSLQSAATDDDAGVKAMFPQAFDMVGKAAQKVYMYAIEGKMLAISPTSHAELRDVTPLKFSPSKQPQPSEILKADSKPVKPSKEFQQPDVAAVPLVFRCDEGMCQIAQCFLCERREKEYNVQRRAEQKGKNKAAADAIKKLLDDQQCRMAQV